MDNEEEAHNNKISMGAYKDSFSMFFGFNSVDAKKMDPIDNDYYKIEAFPWINNKIHTNKPYRLKLCKAEDVKWVKVPMESYYKNAICFVDENEIELQADWYLKTHIIPFISVTHCKGKPTCKPKAVA